MATPAPEVSVEKQVSDSSSNEGGRDVITADAEKAILGQAPFPQQIPAEPAPIALTKLDSHPPKSLKEKQEEQKKKRIEDPFKHLPDDEATILRRQLDTPPVKIGYFDLFRYATKIDLLIIVVGSICAIAGGAAMPLMTVVFGSLTSTFGNYFQTPPTLTYDDFLGQISHLTLYFVCE